MSENPLELSPDTIELAPPVSEEEKLRQAEAMKNMAIEQAKMVNEIAIQAFGPPDPLELMPGTARPESSWWETIKSIPESGLTKFGQSLGGIIKAAGEVFDSPSLVESGTHAYRGASMRQAEIAPNIPQGSWKSDVYGAGVSGMAMIPGLALSAVTMSPAPALGSIFLQTAGEAYGEGREKPEHGGMGLTVGQALLRAQGVGNIEWVTERIPMKTLFKQGTPFVKRLAKELVQELVGENVNQVVEDLMDWSFKNPNKTFSDFFTSQESLKQRWENFKSTTIQTAMLTVPITAGVHPLVNRQIGKMTNNIVDQIMPDLEGVNRSEVADLVRSKIEEGTLEEKSGQEIIDSVSSTIKDKYSSVMDEKAHASITGITADQNKEALGVLNMRTTDERLDILRDHYDNVIRPMMDRIEAKREKIIQRDLKRTQIEYIIDKMAHGDMTLTESQQVIYDAKKKYIDTRVDRLSAKIKREGEAYQKSQEKLEANYQKRVSALEKATTPVTTTETTSPVSTAQAPTAPATEELSKASNVSMTPIKEDTTLAVRQGEVSKEGAHFSTAGTSSYYDLDNKDAKKYDLKEAKIAESGSPEMRQILTKALEIEIDPKIKKEIESALVSDNTVDNFVDYQLNDSTDSITKAGKELGFDGVKIWESDDISGPSTINLWNVSKAKEVTQNAESVRVDEGRVSEGGTVTETSQDKGSENIQLEQVKGSEGIQPEAQQQVGQGESKAEVVIPKQDKVKKEKLVKKVLIEGKEKAEKRKQALELKPKKNKKLPSREVIESIIDDIYGTQLEAIEAMDSLGDLKREFTVIDKGELGFLIMRKSDLEEVKKIDENVKKIEERVSSYTPQAQDIINTALSAGEGETVASTVAYYTAKIDDWFNKKGSSAQLSEILDGINENLEAAQKVGRQDYIQEIEALIQRLQTAQLARTNPDAVAKGVTISFMGTGDIVEGVRQLTTLGVRLYSDLRMRFPQWAERMHTYLSNIWDTVRPYMNTIWEDMKSILQDNAGKVYFWHGAGRLFDKFNTDFIGTQQGAASFGWGLYFSSLKSVAKWYADTYGKVKEVYSIGNIELSNILWGGPDRYIIEDPNAHHNEVKQMLREKIETFAYTISAKEERIVELEERIAGLERMADEENSSAFKSDSWMRTILSEADAYKSEIGVYKNQIQEYKGHIDLLTKAINEVDNGGKVSKKNVSTKHLYYASVADELVFMDWYDKTPGHIKKMIAEQIKKENLGGDIGKELITVLEDPTYESTGQTIYKYLVNIIAGPQGLMLDYIKYQQKASEFLLRAGIHGNQYAANTVSNPNAQRVPMKVNTYTFNNDEKYTEDVTKALTKAGVLGSSTSDFYDGFISASNSGDEANYLEHKTILLHFVNEALDKLTDKYELMKGAQASVHQSEVAKLASQIRYLHDFKDDITIDNLVITRISEMKTPPYNYVLFDGNLAVIENVITLSFLGLDRVYNAIANIFKKRTFNSQRQAQLEVDGAGTGVNLIDNTPKDINSFWTIFSHSFNIYGMSQAAKAIAYGITKAELLFRSKSSQELDFIDRALSGLSNSDKDNVHKLGYEVEALIKEATRLLTSAGISGNTLDNELNIIRDNYIDQFTNYSDKVKSKYKELRSDFFNRFRDIYKTFLMRELRYHSKPEFLTALDNYVASVTNGIAPQAAMTNAITGLQQSDMSAFRRFVIDYFKEVEEIENWGDRDYWSHMMRGSYVIYAIGGSGKKRIATVGLNVDSAIRRAEAFLAQNPDTISMTMDNKFMYADELLTLVGRKNFFAIRNKFANQIMQLNLGMNKALARMIAQKATGKVFAVRPGEVFAAPTIDSKHILPGEENIETMLKAYALAMWKKMSYDPIIWEFRSKQGELGKRERIHLENILKWSKGSMGAIDESLSQALGFISRGYIQEVRPFSKFVNKSRSLTATLKLGYRPISGMLNAADAYSRIWVQFGERALAVGIADLQSTAGKALAEKYADYLGAKPFETPTGHVTSGVRFLGHTFKGFSQVLAPLGLYNMAELPARQLNFITAYRYFERSEAAEGRKATEEAAADFALRSVYTLQGANTIASMPAMFRTPGGRMFGLFRPFLIRTVEWIANNATSIGFWVRFLPYVTAMAGTRGLLLMAKSIPIIAMIAAGSTDPDKIEKWLLQLDTEIQKRIGKAAYGIPGLFGVDVSAPATIQMPDFTRIDDLIGAVPSTLIKGVLASIMALHSINAKAELKQIAKQQVPAARNILDVIDAYTDREGWVRDESGNKKFQLTSGWDNWAVLMGMKTVEKSAQEMLSRKGMLARNIQERETAQLLKYFGTEVAKLNAKTPEGIPPAVARKIQEHLSKYDMSPDMLVKKAESVNLAPAALDILRSSPRIKMDIYRDYREMEKSFQYPFLTGKPAKSNQ